jgi:hypothetical protein
VNHIEETGRRDQSQFPPDRLESGDVPFPIRYNPRALRDPEAYGRGAPVLSDAPMPRVISATHTEES